MNWAGVRRHRLRFGMHQMLWQLINNSACTALSSVTQAPTPVGAIITNEGKPNRYGHILLPTKKGASFW